jgi:hypothetical protein
MSQQNIFIGQSIRWRLPEYAIIGADEPIKVTESTGINLPANLVSSSLPAAVVFLLVLHGFRNTVAIKLPQMNVPCNGNGHRRKADLRCAGLIINRALDW